MGGDERKEEAVQAAAEQTRYPSPGTPWVPGTMEALFKEHYGAVYRAAYRITGDPMDAEDVLQTVFTRILRREEELDLSQGAGSYLHRAAVNAALDLLRQRKRRPSRSWSTRCRSTRSSSRRAASFAAGCAPLSPA
jgi:DNA-directed RNA polymerase specialized sigma24 family protein